MASYPEIRQLLLDTRDIGWVTPLVSQTSYQANGYTSTVGTLNNRLTDATWYRIDMKQLLGWEVWDAYSQFNIILRSWTVNNMADLGSNDTTNGENFNDRSLFIMMSGVHWVNNYSVARKNIDREAILGCYSSTNTGTSEGFAQMFYNSSVQTFDKQNGPIVDLRVRLLRTCDMQPPIMNGIGNTSNSAPTNLVHWSMVFDICPVSSSRTSDKTLTTF